MKLNRLAAVLVLVGVSATLVLAQAEQVKGKAKDLKRDIESKQTNTVRSATNAPAKK
jgi:hypothetical protein